MSIPITNKKQPLYSICHKNIKIFKNITESSLQWTGELKINRTKWIKQIKKHFKNNNIHMTAFIIKIIMTTAKTMFRVEARKYFLRMYLNKKQMTAMDVQEELKTF
jgi:hypothetical protein